MHVLKYVSMNTLLCLPTRFPHRPSVSEVDGLTVLAGWLAGWLVESMYRNYCICGTALLLLLLLLLLVVVSKEGRISPVYMRWFI